MTSKRDRFKDLMRKSFALPPYKKETKRKITENKINKKKKVRKKRQNRKRGRTRRATVTHYVAESPLF